MYNCKITVRYEIHYIFFIFLLLWKVCSYFLNAISDTCNFPMDNADRITIFLSPRGPNSGFFPSVTGLLPKWYMKFQLYCYRWLKRCSEILRICLHSGPYTLKLLLEGKIECQQPFCFVPKLWFCKPRLQLSNEVVKWSMKQ